MGVVTGLVLFAIIWFMCLFVVLPFFVRTQGDVGESVRGTPQSAPASGFGLKRHLAINTGIALVVWGAIAGVILSGAVGIEDIDLFTLFGLGDSSY